MTDRIKLCPKCGEVKPHGPNAGHHTGYQVWCRDCQRASNRKWSASEQGKEFYRRYRANLREQMFEAYGRVCACCGEDEPAFLGLDHIDGVPADHRTKSGKRISNDKILLKLRAEGWPAGYQVLCHNCNMAKGFFGECPHQARKLRVVTDA